MTVAYIETMMPFDERKRRLRGRHHLRHELRVRLRLPARQHGDLARRRRPARPRATRSWTRSTRSSIDEARTPLIISGEPTTAAKIYYDFARDRPDAERRPVARARSSRTSGSRRSTTTSTTRSTRPSRRPSRGSRRSSARCGSRTSTTRRTSSSSTTSIQALKAEALYKRDVDYVVQDGEVKIVDEFTGRIMEGRRWSEGLHQAVEAKEGVAIQEEHQTLATITLQNYFRLYEKLGGMTGTAKTEEKEFVEIYGLERRRDPDQRRRRPRRQERPDLQDEGGEVRRRRRRHQGARTTRASRCSSARSPSRPPST